MLEVLEHFSNDMGFVTIDPNNINIDDDHFDEDNPDNIVLIRLNAWCTRFKQHAARKQNIDEKVMLRGYHPARVEYWCMTKDENLAIE